jgi:hypothetical protein
MEEVTVEEAVKEAVKEAVTVVSDRARTGGVGRIIVVVVALVVGLTIMIIEIV